MDFNLMPPLLFALNKQLLVFFLLVNPLNKHYSQPARLLLVMDQKWTQYYALFYPVCLAFVS